MTNFLRMKEKKNKQKEINRNKLVKWFWIIVTAPFALIALLLLLVGIFARIPSLLPHGPHQKPARPSAPGRRLS